MSDITIAPETALAAEPIIQLVGVKKSFGPVSVSSMTGP